MQNIHSKNIIFLNFNFMILIRYNNMDEKIYMCKKEYWNIFDITL